MNGLFPQLKISARRDDPCRGEGLGVTVTNMPRVPYLELVDAGTAIRSPAAHGTTLLSAHPADIRKERMKATESAAAPSSPVCCFLARRLRGASTLTPSRTSVLYNETPWSALTLGGPYDAGKHPADGQKSANTSP